MRIHTHSKWKSQSSAYRLREKVLKGRYRRWHGNDYKASVTGLTLCHYGSPVISSGGTSQYESHSFVEPVKRSREISLQNAAFRQSVRHRVSFRRLPSYNRVEIIHPSHTTVRTVRYTAVRFFGQEYIPACHFFHFLKIILSPPFRIFASSAIFRQEVSPITAFCFNV